MREELEGISDGVVEFVSQRAGSYHSRRSWISVKIQGLIRAPRAIMMPSTPDMSTSFW